ncbi:hypothetical protein XELAEV_18011666mg [Xenopus laevis]|uniref:Uncharacterized protein n=1 Tax=Xenopus laevis TaxID=8355 RepID=A0A974DNU7_XENLA|nr:hypothetical protein XELAEV_18011666mg [Xenopus laevis]
MQTQGHVHRKGNIYHVACIGATVYLAYGGMLWHHLCVVASGTKQSARNLPQMCLSCSSAFIFVCVFWG